MARWVFGLGGVAALVLYFDTGQLISALGRTRWSLALPAILGLTAMHLVGAATWKMLAARLSGVRWRWSPVARAYYAGQAVGSLTPASIGSDLYRVHAAAGGADSWRGAVLPVAAQRVSSYLALLLLGLAATNFVAMPLALGRILGLSAGLLVVGVASVWVLGRSRFAAESPAGRLVRRFRLPASAGLVPSRRLWATLGAALILSGVFHAGSIALGYVLLMATGTTAAIVPTVGALTLARLAILLPISISGLGIQEGALAALFPLVGIPAETGLAVSLLNRLAFLLTIVIGVVFVRIRRDSRQLADHKQAVGQQDRQGLLPE